LFHNFSQLFVRRNGPKTTTTTTKGQEEEEEKEEEREIERNITILGMLYRQLVGSTHERTHRKGGHVWDPAKMMVGSAHL
jgi:hypothetical protein